MNNLEKKVWMEVIEKNFIEFGNYLLSNERRESIMQHPTFTDEQKNESLMQVGYADLCNWLEKQKGLEKPLD